MKLYAISDLHLALQCNREALAALPAYPEDWLILAGDIGETTEHLHFALSLLTPRFAKIIWVPGNHDLWTVPSKDEPPLRGEEKYLSLVEICRRYDVITPEDPYLLWPGAGAPTLLVPLFLLYDYSFRPEGTSVAEALHLAEEARTVCTDETLLHPTPYPSRIAWCHARCDEAERRLQAIPDSYSLILINHFPLRREHVRVNRIPRFSIWCGTTRTTDWHIRFRASVVVYGHVHVRATDYRDGVRFEEVSLGYKQNWDQNKGLQSYLREILPGPAISSAPRHTQWYP